MTEGLLRLTWPQQEDDVCFLRKDGVNQHRANCTTMLKTAEGPWTEYSYNDCGYRNPEPCGPKPANALRVAVVGSSLAGGAFVPYPDTFYARAAADLKKACGRPVEFQDLGGFGFVWNQIASQVPPALALQPDAVVMAMMPFDLERSPPSDHPPPKSLMVRVKDFIRGLRFIRVGQHFLFADDDHYTNIYLKLGDKADFLRTPLSPVWNDRLSRWEALLASMADQAHAAGVPFVLAVVPQRAQLTLLGKPAAPGIEADILIRALQAMSERHGIIFVDVGQKWAGIHARSDIYYRVDGHPTAYGHELLGKALDDVLLSGAVPAFAHCSPHDLARND